MKLRKYLLVVIAATGIMGSVQAQTDLGILDPTPKVRTGLFTAGQASFGDVFNFSIGADNHSFLGSAVGLAANGTPTLGAITNLTFDLFAGSNATGPIKGSVTSVDGSMISLAGALAEGAYSARISGLITNAALGGGYQLSVSANPEPATWMMLLAGLVLVAFIARRKTSLVAACPA
jgi:hypothetical protein